MNKKLLMAAPALALGLAGLSVADTFAMDVSDDKQLISCMENEESCTLVKDIFISDNITIEEGRLVNLDLAGHNITTGGMFTLERGGLNISGSGTISTNELKEPEKKSVEVEYLKGKDKAAPLFDVVGGKPESKSFANLTIGKDVTLSTVEKNIINNDYIGSTINIYGHLISDAGFGIFNNNNDGDVATQHKIPNTININKGASIQVGSYTAAIQSLGYAKVHLDGAEITTSCIAIDMSAGDFTIDDATITRYGNACSGKAGAILIEEIDYTYANSSFIINSGKFTTEEGALFMERSMVSGTTQIGEIAIKGGTFVAPAGLLFVMNTPNFNHTGFIAGGTFQGWHSEYNDYGLVAENYVTDYQKTARSATAVILPASVTGLPQGYSLDIRRSTLTQKSFSALEEMLKEQGIKGTPLKQIFGIRLLGAKDPQEILKNDVTVSLPVDVDEKGPAEGYVRKYQVVICHTDFEDNPLCDGEEEKLEIVDATYENGHITFKTNRFSYFAVVYQDVEDTNVPVPDTGAGISNKSTNAVSTTLSLFMLAGSAITTFIGVKAYRKKQ